MIHKKVTLAAKQLNLTVNKKEKNASVNTYIEDCIKHMSFFSVFITISLVFLDLLKFMCLINKGHQTFSPAQPARVDPNTRRNFTNPRGVDCLMSWRKKTAPFFL